MATSGQKDLFAYAADNGPSIVYQAVNTANNKIYVGITRKNMHARFMQHQAKAKAGSKTPFHNAIRKYGADAFILYVLAWCDSYLEAKQSEQKWISEIRPDYNVTAGGDGVSGLRHTKESKARMSAARRGITSHMAGKRHSEETKQRISFAKRQNPTRYWLGKARDQYTIEKMSAAKRGKSPSILADAANKARRKTVQCLTDGRLFQGAQEAADFYGIGRSMVYHSIRGDAHPSSGLKFAYVEKQHDN